MTIRDAAPLDREHDDRDECDRGAARADDPYLELFEQAPCGYLETTPDGIITRVNRTFERWTGHAREALLGTTFVELLTSSGQLFYETRLAMVLSLSGEVREVALSVRCADDSELPILVNAVAVTGPDGAPRGIRIAVFDATERQDYERQLLLARRGAEASEARVRVLQDASSAFDAATSAHELAAALVASAGGALRASGAAVLLADDSGPLELVAGDETTLALFPAGLGALAEQAIGSGEIVTVANLDQAAAIMPGLDDALHRQRLAALSIVPLRTDERTRGVVVSLFGRDRHVRRREPGDPGRRRPPGRPGAAPSPPPGGARAQRDARPAHRARQPQAARGAARCGHRRGLPQPAAALRGVRGPRRLQGDQRQPRPPGRRRRARRGRLAPPVGGARGRLGGPVRRRRVRHRVRGRHAGCRRDHRGAIPAGGATPTRVRPAAIRRRGEHRGRRLGAGAGIRAGRRPAAAHGGRGHVRVEGLGPGSRHPGDGRHDDSEDPTQHSTTTRPEAAWEH